MSNCPGADGLVCVDGWLYSQLNMMIFPANKKCPTCNQFHKLRYTCPSCCKPLERKTAQYYWRGVVTHGWVCPKCNCLWDIGGAFVKYVEKRSKKDGPVHRKSEEE